MNRDLESALPFPRNSDYTFYTVAYTVEVLGENTGIIIQSSLLIATTCPFQVVGMPGVISNLSMEMHAGGIPRYA